MRMFTIFTVWMLLPIPVASRIDLYFLPSFLIVNGTVALLVFARNSIYNCIWFILGGHYWMLLPYPIVRYFYRTVLIILDILVFSNFPSLCPYRLTCLTMAKSHNLLTF